MIDWVTAELPFEHEYLNSGAVFKVKPDGDIDWSTRCALHIPGSYESSIQVKSIGSAAEGRASHLKIHGNPSKYLQGHNIFGSDDLLSLVFDTYLKIIANLKLQPSLRSLKIIKQGDYELSRLDINYSWELPTLSDVNAWLRAAEYSSKTRHGRPEMKGGTVYWGKHSKRWALKAYAKGEEIQAKHHKLPDALQQTLLPKWAQNKLRIEAVIRGKQLEEDNLKLAKNWNEERVKTEYYKYLARLTMKENIQLTDEKMNELPCNLLSTYTLWKEGHDLRSLLPKTTYYRRRKQLLEFGINIDFQSNNKNKKTNVIPLLKVLEAKPVEIPSWAFEQNLVHKSTNQIELNYA